MRPSCPTYGCLEHTFGMKINVLRDRLTRRTSAQRERRHGITAIVPALHARVSVHKVLCSLSRPFPRTKRQLQNEKEQGRNVEKPSRQVDGICEMVGTLRESQLKFGHEGIQVRPGHRCPAALDCWTPPPQPTQEQNRFAISRVHGFAEKEEEMCAQYTCRAEKHLPPARLGTGRE